MVNSVFFNEKMEQEFNCCNSKNFLINPQNDDSMTNPNAATSNEQPQQNIIFDQVNFNQLNFNNPVQDWSEEYTGGAQRLRHTFPSEHYRCNEYCQNSYATFNNSSIYCNPGNMDGYSAPPNEGYVNSNSSQDCRFSGQSWVEDETKHRLQHSGIPKPKEKYRVVYTDFQKKQLEKQFISSKYINVQTKADLADKLGLTQRQIKIWFQNRRAKERKLLKKQQEMLKSETMQKFNSMEFYPQTSTMNPSTPLVHFGSDQNQLHYLPIKKEP